MATIEQLEAALRKADAAGNVDDARALANAIRQMRGSAPKQPAAKPDFSNVRASAQTTQSGDPFETFNFQNRNNYDPAEFDRWQAQQTADAYRKMPAVARFAAGTGEPVSRLLRGTAQLFDREEPKGIAGLIAGPRATPMQKMEERERRIAEATVKSDLPGSLGRIAGDVALTAVPLSRVTAATRLGKLATAASTGAAYAGLQPVVQGESRGQNMAVGGALGLAGQLGSDALVASGARAAKAITPELRKLYEAARARGIELTPAQLSDSKALKFIQSQLSRLPIIGGDGGLAAQRATWNHQLAAEIGEDAPMVTPEVYARAKARQSAEFNDLTSRNDLQVTPELIRKLEAIRSEAGIDADAAAAADNALSAFYRQITDAPGMAEGGGLQSAALGNLPGRAYQALDSSLGNVTKRGDTSAHYVGQIRSAIREAMDGSISPEDATAWRLLRQQYGNRKTLRDLVAKGEGGEISPAALMGRVTANNAGKEAMASGGRGGLGELARIGQRLKEPQSSGTAERLAPALMGAGAVANLPATLAALVGGSALKKGLDSPTLAKLMLREGRGNTRQALAPFVRAAGIAATPAVTEENRKKPRR